MEETITSEIITSEIEWVNSFQPNMWASSGGQQKQIEGMPVPYMANCVNKLKKTRKTLAYLENIDLDCENAIELVDDKISEFKYFIPNEIEPVQSENLLNKMYEAFGKEFIDSKIKVVEQV